MVSATLQIIIHAGTEQSGIPNGASSAGTCFCSVIRVGRICNYWPQRGVKSSDHGTFHCGMCFKYNKICVVVSRSCHVTGHAEWHWPDKGGSNCYGRCWRIEGRQFPKLPDAHFIFTTPTNGVEESLVVIPTCAAVSVPCIERPVLPATKHTVCEGPLFPRSGRYKLKAWSHAENGEGVGSSSEDTHSARQAQARLLLNLPL